MYYYLVVNSRAIQQLPEPPTDGSNWAQTDELFNLDLYEWWIGSMDESHNVTMRSPVAKPPEQLAATIIGLQQQIGNLTTMFSLMDAALEVQFGGA